MPKDCAALKVGMRADLVDAVNVDVCRRNREDVKGLIQPSKSPLFLPAWVEAPGAHRANWNGEMLPLQEILRRSCPCPSPSPGSPSLAKTRGSKIQ